MPGKRTIAGVFLLATSMLAGGLASAAVVSRFIDAGTGPGLLSFVLGAAFGGLGWLLTETIVEGIVFLVITTVMGGVALIFLKSGILRIIVIAFVCGFNIGKLAGGVYREYQ